MQEKNLSEQIIKNGVIFPCLKNTPSGVFKENDTQVLNFNGEISTSSEKVVFLGSFAWHYGHFITESLSRLWWIVKHSTKGVKFVCLMEKDSFLPFQSYILRLFNLDDSNLIVIKKPTKFAQITVPDDSFWNENGIEMHRKMIDFITSKVTPQRLQNNKFYLSRRKFDKARSLEFGEEFFEEFYAQKGYKIIYPEMLSPKEQLAIFIGGGGALSFAAMAGTISHNTIFAPYGSRLDIILKADNALTLDFSRIQPRINKIKKLKIQTIKSYANLGGIDGGRGPFLILPRNVAMNDERLKAYKNTILRYIDKYQHDFLKNQLYKEEKPSKEQLYESLRHFQNEIKSIDERLFESLSKDFRRLKFWVDFYVKSQKIAWWAWRGVNFPRILSRETKRLLEQILAKTIKQNSL